MMSRRSSCRSAIGVRKVPCRPVQPAAALQCRVIVGTATWRPVALHGPAGQSASCCPVGRAGRLRKPRRVGGRAVMVRRRSRETGLWGRKTGLGRVLLPVGCRAGRRCQVVEAEAGLELVWGVEVRRVRGGWRVLVVVVVVLQAGVRVPERGWKVAFAQRSRSWNKNLFKLIRFKRKLVQFNHFMNLIMSGNVLNRKKLLLPSQKWQVRSDQSDKFSSFLIHSAKIQCWVCFLILSESVELLHFKWHAKQKKWTFSLSTFLVSRTYKMKFSANNHRRKSCILKLILKEKEKKKIFCILKLICGSHVLRRGCVKDNFPLHPSEF